MYRKLHATTCPGCQADLTVDDSVRVHLSCTKFEFDANSSLDSDGLLIDDDHFVRNGYHAGTFCRACEELLDELEPAVKRFSWYDLLRGIVGIRSRAGQGLTTEEQFNQDVTIEHDGEFFRCLSFEQVGETDVLDKGHWFLRVEKIDE